MDFLGIGGGEIFVIIIIAVLLWGPGRIVEIARGMGKVVHNLKSTTSEFTSQITKELEEGKKDLASTIDEAKKAGTLKDDDR